MTTKAKATTKKTVKTKKILKAPAKRMTKKEMRIAIAHDVIAQLRKTNVTNEGFYLFSNTIKVDDAFLESSAQEKCSLLRKNCEVCAKGAMMLSHVGLFNKLTVGDFADFYGASWSTDDKDTLESDNDTIVEHLSKYFPEWQLDMIEIAFEKFQANTGSPQMSVEDTLSIYDRFSDNKTESLIEKAYDFCDHDMSPKDRLRKIMKNIIANDGTFKP